MILDVVADESAMTGDPWRRATARTGTLAEFFAASPLAELTDDELRLFDREHSDPAHRAVEL